MYSNIFFRCIGVVLVAISLAVPATNRASMLAVQSATDSSGLFTYAVLHGPEPYLWGDSNATLSLAPALFELHSVFIIPVAYDSLATTALYQQGTLLGDVFSTNQMLYQGSVNGEVTSVNIGGLIRLHSKRTTS